MKTDTAPYPRAKRVTICRDGRILLDGKDHHRYCNRSGRWVVAIRADDGCQDICQVARLVGEAFCQDFKPYLLAAHRDGNRANCAADNLMWVTRSSVTVASPGAKRKTAKLTERKVRAIRESKDRLVDVAMKYGISHGHASMIRRGVAWKHVPLEEGTQP